MADDIDQLIMAYADRALSGEEARRVEKLIDSDPALAEQLKLYQRASHARLSGLFTEGCDRPVPGQLQKVCADLDKALRRPAKVEDAVEPGRVARKQNALSDWFGGISFGGWVLSSGAAVLALLAGPLLFAGIPASDPFRISLETAQSGQQIRYMASGGERIIVPLISFRSRDNEFCRLYELTRDDSSRLSGIACRTQSGAWPIKIETQAPAGPVRGYATARSAIPPVLGDAVEAMIEGTSFGPEEENAMLRRGWKQQ